MNILVAGCDGFIYKTLIKPSIPALFMPKVKLSCEQCKKEFYVYKSAKERGRKFCSRGCSMTYRNFHNNPMWKLEIKLKATKNRPSVVGANNPRARWVKMTEEEARVVFEQYKSSGMALGKFAREVCHTNNTRLTLMFRKYFANEYEAFVEQKCCKLSTPYRRGSRFEYRVRDHYKGLKYFVWRSPKSRGPADLIAIKRGEILLIQCKLNGMLYGKEKRALVELAQSIDAKPILAWRKGRKKLIIEEVN